MPACVVAPAIGGGATRVVRADVSASLQSMHLHEALRMRILRSASAALAALVPLCASMPAHAAIYRVGSGSGCTHATIQAAIDAAAATPDADEVRLGTTSYNLAGLSIGANGGALVITGGYASCVASAPAAGQRAVLVGNGTRSVVRIRDTHTLQLANLDIRQGQSVEGGGIDVQGSPSGGEVDVIVLSNTLVRGNGALKGGGISVKNTLGSSAQPGNLQVILFGGSNVVSNTAVEGGGGVRCERATFIVRDDSHIGLNSASDGDGGGISGVDCEVVIGSRGVSGNGAVLWSNTATGTGGGLHLEGASARADIYTVDAHVPARVTGNSGIAGGAILARNGARVRLFDAVLEQNRAEAYGGAIALSGTPGSGQTTLLMQRAGSAAPLAAVPCADAEACNLVRANSVTSGAGSLGRAGAAIVAFSSTPDAVRADFRGTRLDFNDGTTLAYLGGSYAEVHFSGALVVNNIATEGVISSEGSGESTVEVSSSTLASNSIGEGHAVIRGKGACANEQGTRVRNSIVWQPQRPLIAPIGILDGACFRHLLGNDFGALPAAADRVVAEPFFLNAAGGQFHVSTGSPAIDFAPAIATDATRDGVPRVIDDIDRVNRFGPQDAGAYERYSDRIFETGFDCKEC